MAQQELPPSCASIAAVLLSTALPPPITAGEELTVAKIYGMHPIRLHPGVDGAEFERFFTEEFARVVAAESGAETAGWKAHLLKGDKGDRVGQYMLMVEIESEEARGDAHDQTSEEIAAEEANASEEWRSVMAKWRTFTPNWLGENTVYTDYVVVGTV